MARNIRGRWSQYQILRSNENLTPHLFQTELLEEETLYQYLQDHLTIRPCFGQSEIMVSKTEDNVEKYVVTMPNQVAKYCSTKSEAFQYLQTICKKEKFYILQDTSPLYITNELRREFLVTVQRDLNNCWKVVGILSKYDASKARKTILNEAKIQEVAIEVASYLVNNADSYTTVVIEITTSNENLWLCDINVHYPKSKWSQYQILSKIQSLSPLLPKTELATPASFLLFMKEFKEIMIKPCHGQWGMGIVQVSLTTDGTFDVHYGRNKLTIVNVEEMIHYLQINCFSKDQCIVQERINIATIDECPFDTRILALREDSLSNWDIAAKITKIAAKNYIVTNVAKSLIPVEEAFARANINIYTAKKIVMKMDEACLIGALHLGKYYRDVTRIGADMGIDKNGDLWMFEMNLVPDIGLFTRLKDKSIYKNILNKTKKQEKEN